MNGLVKLLVRLNESIASLASTPHSLLPGLHIDEGASTARNNDVAKADVNMKAANAAPTSSSLSSDTASQLYSSRISSTQVDTAGGDGDDSDGQEMTAATGTRHSHIAMQPRSTCTSPRRTIRALMVL
jgi:hypothetical protein